MVTRIDEFMQMPKNVTLGDIRSGRFGRANHERSRILYPHLHRQIRHTAKELAGKFYESNKRSDNFRALWPAVRDYIRDCWPLYIKEARQALAQLLASPNITDHLKGEIYNALTTEDRDKF